MACFLLLKSLVAKSSSEKLLVVIHFQRRLKSRWVELSYWYFKQVMLSANSVRSTCVWRSNACRCCCSLITHSGPAAFAPDDVPTVCSAWIMNGSHQPTHLLLSAPSSCLLSGYIIKLLRWAMNNQNDAGPDCSAPLPPDRTAGNICSAQNKHLVSGDELERFCRSGLWSRCSAQRNCVCKLND